MADSKPVSARSAAIIQFVSKYCTIAIQLVLSAVLARLLTPDDFGEVAIVTVFTGFFSLFADMGIGAAIVQFQDLQKRDFERLFSFSVVLAGILLVLFCALSMPLSAFYGDPGLVPIFFSVTPMLVFNTLNMVPNGLMLREKQFKSIGLRLVVATVTAGVAGVVCAFLGMGPYALAVQLDLSAVIVFFWNLLRSPIRGLDFHFMGPLREIFSYSSFQFGFNTINYFSRNLDNLLIGKVFGDAPLGFYDKAYKLTTFPLSAFSGIISSIVQPYMAEHQDHKEVIWGFWFKAEKLISLVGAFVAAGCVACSREIILLFYGPQWAASVPLFALLSLSIYTQMVSSTTGGFFQSLGRTDLLFKVGLFNTTMTILLLCCGLLSRDLTVTAGFITFAYVVNVFVNAFGLIKKGFGESLKVMARFLPEVFCAIVAASLALWVGTFVGAYGLLVSLLVKGAIVVAVIAAGYAVTHQYGYLKILIKR